MAIKTFEKYLLTLNIQILRRKEQLGFIILTKCDENYLQLHQKNET